MLHIYMLLIFLVVIGKDWRAIHVYPIMIISSINLYVVNDQLLYIYIYKIIYSHEFVVVNISYFYIKRRPSTDLT